MKPILEIQNLSKKFIIQHEKQSYLSLRDSISKMFTLKNSSSENFYALKDVNFNVYPGESIGIIGKNGAGKSTLLKILSKITPPSSGKIISRGRIASLLEVGTGFHSELSGRENIFLNGSILGMKRKEIENKFDEIVDFSGTEKFLDTALKHYSSGMQLRLAFAVAAFLEPEILIIDEVLAVGDAEFQKKCMGKMGDVSKSGRTILFVSHNLGAVESLCQRSILLEKGLLKFEGKTADIVNKYLLSNEVVTKYVNYTPNNDVFFNTVELNDDKNLIKNTFDYGEKINIACEISSRDFSGNAMVGIAISRIDNNIVFYDEQEYSLTNNETKKINIIIPDNTLVEGTYKIRVVIHKPNLIIYDSCEDFLSFSINNRSIEHAKYDLRYLGNVYVKCSWT